MEFLEFQDPLLFISCICTDCLIFSLKLIYCKKNVLPIIFRVQKGTGTLNFFEGTDSIPLVPSGKIPVVSMAFYGADLQIDIVCNEVVQTIFIYK
jgi:hypothetical protein